MEAIKFTPDLKLLTNDDLKQFRLGNVVYYEIIDEGWNEDLRNLYIGEIEVDDFKGGLSGMGINHYAIPLTEYWLVNKFGFEDWGVVEVNQYEKYHRFVLRNAIGGTSNFEVHIIKSNYGQQHHKEICFSIDNDDRQRTSETNFVHNLQNAFYLCEGSELELKTEVNQ